MGDTDKLKNNFELLLNNMEGFIWLFDSQFKITYASPTIEQVLGISANAFLNSPVEKLFPDQSLAQLNRKLNELKIAGKSDQPHGLELIFIVNQNTQIKSQTTLIPSFDNHDAFDGVICITRTAIQYDRFMDHVQENEANLMAQIDNTPDSIWSIDNNYCIKTLNKNFASNFNLAFGVQLKPGINIIEHLPEPLRTLWKERYDKSLLGEHYTVTDHFEFEYVPQYVEVNFNPILFKNSVVGVSCFSRDITQTTLIQKRFEESTANLSSLIENTEARIWSIDNDFNIISINTNFKNDFNIAFGVALEKGVSALSNVPEPLYKIWHERYSRVLKGENYTIIEEFQIQEIPNFVEVNFNPILLDKKIVGATCYSRDISAQILAEKALKESENRIKNIISNLPSTTYRCLNDKWYTMKFISSEVENLTGYSPTDLIENKVLSFTSLIHPDDRKIVLGQLPNNQMYSDNYELEYRIIHKNRSIKWVHERGRAQLNSKNEIEYFDGVITDITLQKENEQKLLKSENEFRTLSDASINMLALPSKQAILEYTGKILTNHIGDAVILTVDINEGMNHLSMVSIHEGENQKMLSSLNWSQNTIRLNKSLNSILKPGGLNLLASQQINALNETPIYDIYNQLAAKITVSETYSIGINHDNKLYAAVFIFVLNANKLEDIDFIKSFINLSALFLQHSHLLSALQTSEDKFRSIFENSNSIISIQTPDTFLLVNKAWEKITGYTAEESKTLIPIDLAHPNERQRTAEIMKKRLRGETVETNYVFHLMDKSFNEKWIDMSATVINFEGIPAILINGNDITERKNAEIELNKFSTGIMNSPSSIVITDIDGNIEYVNPYFSEFTGYTAEEALGNNPRILNSGKNDQAIFIDLWSTILRGEVWNGEFLNKKKSGEFYWESARIAPIFDQYGVITNFIAIKEDITTQKRTMELIEQSAKDLRQINAQKDKFFSIIAHDLRSPFSGLSGLTEILRTSFREMDDIQVERYLELISDSTQHLYKLLENLLAWAKTQTGKAEFKPKILPLNHLVENTISIVTINAKNKQLTIINRIDPEIVAFADENMLDTIIRNLLSNAIKYSFKNGSIEVSSKIQSIKNKMSLVVSISDNGVGIPLDKQNMLFKIEENYTTTGTEKEKGSGLGLILCKEFVEMHGGKIWCESTENQGSVFSFSLPLPK